MGETSKHASSKHKRKERRSAERTMARDGADRLAEAARKREAAEAAARKQPPKWLPAATAPAASPVALAFAQRPAWRCRCRRTSARSDGLVFRHELIGRTPNTRDAHRLIWLAGREGVQGAVVEALFSAYFHDGRDVGDRTVLIEVGKVSRIYFRADAGFANPEVYEYLEAERIKYAIRLPANHILQERIGYLLKRPVGRPSVHAGAIIPQWSGRIFR
jgi:hypothetical protein